MDSRQQFEEWMVEAADRFHPDFTRRGIEGEYQNVGIEHDWGIWQASRESLVIQLPKAHLEFEGDPAPELFESEVLKAIHALGIRTK